MTSEHNTNGEKPASDHSLNSCKNEQCEKIVASEREKYTWFNKIDDAALATTFPDATPAERLRFLISRDGNVEAASKKLEEYLQWRKDTGLDNNSILSTKEKIGTDNPTMKEDDIVWYLATSIAYDVLNASKLVKSLPRITSLAERHKDGRKVTTLDGHRVIQFLGARINLDQAPADVYALSGAIFVDLIQDRHSMEKFVVTIDARPGRGWRNHSASQLVPFIKSISKHLSAYHPERMKGTFFFPLPYIANALWYCIKPFLDPVTAEKIKLFSGSPTVNYPPPKELKKYFDKDVIDYLEKSRTSLFNID